MIRRDYLFQIVGWGAGAALYGFFKRKAAQKQLQEQQHQQQQQQQAQHSHQDHQIEKDSEWEEDYRDEWKGEETNFEQYDLIDSPLKEKRS